MNDGFYRIAAGSPRPAIANPAACACEITALMEQAYAAGADLLVLPELALTGYTCADLFHNKTLLDAVDKAYAGLLEVSKQMPGLMTVVGRPVLCGTTLYNCACAFCNGAEVAVVKKTYLPGYNEFYEQRWFASDDSEPVVVVHKGVGVGIEICEDLWAPVPPSCNLALSGAEVLVNLSASDDLTGKYAYLRDLVVQQSARCIGAYAYASAGFGESSTDLVFDAKLLIAENGRLLRCNERWQAGNQLVLADVDVEAVRRDRMHNTTFEACRRRTGAHALRVVTSAKDDDGVSCNDLLRDVASHPFVPADGRILDDRCEEIVSIQAAALARRLDATRTSNITVGVSGGLDSTLALLVATRAFDRLGLDRKGIVGVTMPGFGTTGRTYSNALTLMKALGVTCREVSIVNAVNGHFEDIGHDKSVHDVTYENSQARERTQILMDIANQIGGMVLGTGDLSELALGWATYNGDHMSMYAVNAGVPKTLVRYLTAYFASHASSEEERAALLDIIDTPISPELLPADDKGEIKQITEDLVGPYDLHDFFLYYTLRYGFTPRRIFKLACKAFDGMFDRATILKWERVFFRRFFTQQFKRSCMPDGPKVGSVCLSPRGDWRMPSDATSAAWLAELDDIEV